MPTYEYVCKNCGETLEVFQSFSDKPLRKHKVCGGQLQKVFHARGIVFKGNGFYATDGKPAPSSKAKKSDSSSDSKPKKSEKSESSEKEGAAASATSSSRDD